MVYLRQEYLQGDTIHIDRDITIIANIAVEDFS